MASIPCLSPSTSPYCRCGPTSRSPDDFVAEDTILRKKPTICAFLPLPPISASPMCTPTSSVSSPSPSLVSPADTLATTVSLLTPTWIATPPTPPKALRRSRTTYARQGPVTQFPPSASFPALMQPHASVKTLSFRGRSLSMPILPTCIMASSQRLSSFDDAFLPARRAIPPQDATFSFFCAPSGRERPSPHPRIFHFEASGTDADETLKDAARTESSSDLSSDDLWESERMKDVQRKFYALKELLSTELGYLRDLRALVMIYFRNLSSITQRSLTASSTFGRASASFTTGPWLQSGSQQTQGSSVSSSSSTTSSDGQGPTTPAKEAKPNTRTVLTTIEVETLIRNGGEILEVHEYFVNELYAVLQPLGIPLDDTGDEEIIPDIGQVEEAIRQVATKFATEASRFNAYQAFCAGHTEALDIIRKAVQQFPSEFDTFEARCTTTVSDWEAIDEDLALALDSQSSSSSRGSPSAQPNALPCEDRKRAVSLTSLDCAVRTLRPRHSMSVVNDSTPVQEPRRERPPPRISFSDYLIKPVQRICKYPLLLDQLLSSKKVAIQRTPSTRSDVDVVVESAAQAMRHVVSLVDEARHRQDIVVQSSLIMSRLLLPAPLNPAITTSLNATFLSSLGPCRLSGSLDVIHCDLSRQLTSSNVKAKYLGAFLYQGGYLILAKASKGKKYEPRHWFSISEFDVVDVDDNSAILPCSFRLTSNEQYFELAAACQREKDAWLDSIREAMAQPSIWSNEPSPSYRLGGKAFGFPGSEDGHNDVANGLPTIRSIAEFGAASDTDFSEPFLASLRGNSKSRRRRADTPPTQRQEAPQGPSRRSSSNSVKAIFSPMSSDAETVVVRRSSAAARLQVDQELQDVISRTCITARSYAFTHEEQLFQSPKDVFSRSNSTTMVGMSRLSKHESVRIPRRRTDDPSRFSPYNKNPKNLQVRLSGALLEDVDSISPVPSPPPTTGAVSVQSSASSTASLPPAPSSPHVFESAPVKSRSFVRNVRELFHFRPVSPNPSHHQASLYSNQHLAPGSRWRWDTHRRRPRSTYDELVGETGAFDVLEKSYAVPSS